MLTVTPTGKYTAARSITHGQVVKGEAVETVLAPGDRFNVDADTAAALAAAGAIDGAEVPAAVAEAAEAELV